MKRTKFNIKYREQIEHGKYRVETGDGEPVRIICWDRAREEYPIVALTKMNDYGGYERVCCVSPKGKIAAEDIELFVVKNNDTEPTEFEKAVFGVAISFHSHPEEIDESEYHSWVKERANKLLNLARQELQKESLTPVYSGRDDFNSALAKGWNTLGKAYADSGKTANDLVAMKPLYDDGFRDGFLFASSRNVKICNPDLVKQVEKLVSETTKGECTLEDLVAFNEGFHLARNIYEKTGDTEAKTPDGAEHHGTLHL